MQLAESSIYISLKHLRKKLYQAQFLMQKTDRVIYGTPLMEASGNTLKYFTLAFTVKEKRVEYLDEAMGYYAVLRNDLEFCVEENIIHYSKPKKAEGSEMTYVNSQKVELFKLIAKIDGDMCKWRACLAKGKTVIA